MVVSTLAVTMLWLGVDKNSQTALAAESIANLSNDRWERRDPFFPLIDPAHALDIQQSAIPTGEEGSYRYYSQGRRDPFHSILDLHQGPVRNDGPLTPLEQYEPSQLRLVGLMWNDKGYRALLETPEGLAYIARLGTAIGLNGTVSHVSEETLVVEQTVRDVFGDEKIREVELNLYQEEDDLTLTARPMSLPTQTLTQASRPDLSTPPAADQALPRQPQSENPLE